MCNSKKLLLVSLLMAFMGMSYAESGNLVDMDVKKSGNDTINFTLYSSNPSAGNAMVRKKSDNSYVILIPNTTSQISNVDFRSVKDLISDINVKTVSDTSDGYTKVTVSAKQPLNINAKTVQSKPVTQEQIAYRTLLQEANTPKQNSIETVSRPVKSIEGNMIVQPSNSTVAKSKPVSQAKSEPPKSNSANVNQIKSEPVKTVQETPPVQIPVQSAIEEEKVTESNSVIQENIVQESENSMDNSRVNFMDSVKVFIIKVAKKIKNSIPKEPLDIPDIPEIPVAAKYIAGGIFMLYVLKKIFWSKKTVSESKSARDYVYPTEKASDTGILNNKYAAITSNDKLNWRGKYNKYNEAVNNPELYEKEKLEAAKQNRYKFISINKINKKRENLEDMYTNGETKSGGMYSEDNNVPINIDDVKLSGFESNTVDLKQTSRHKSTGRFKRYEKFQETAPVELGLSKLNKNMRKFANGALNVFDVKRKTKSIRELKRIEDLKNQDYIMSSLDEFFSVMEDSEPKTAKVQEQSYEPENYRTIKMISRVNMPKKENPTGINLDKAFNDKTSGENNGLNITSSYDIDENHGFYLVNLDGRSALIAKSSENITVLKHFDSIIEKPLQVRQDRDGVYMVKTQGFKSLIEVNGDKVGVLVEL